MKKCDKMKKDNKGKEMLLKKKENKGGNTYDNFVKMVKDFNPQRRKRQQKQIDIEIKKQNKGK